MAFPTPDSLIAIVKPVLDTTASFSDKLAAKMADADTVSDAYRGSGLFSFYVPGYIDDTVIIEVTKELQAAGYVVQAFKQQVGYMPMAKVTDINNVDYNDTGVEGNSTFPWVQVTLYKKKVVL